LLRRLIERVSGRGATCRRGWPGASNAVGSRGGDDGEARPAAGVLLTERQARRDAPSAKLNGINPQAWLADVLARLPDHLAKRIDELLPWHWKAARKALT
jgi:hypothetical protein